MIRTKSRLLSITTDTVLLEGIENCLPSETFDNKPSMAVLERSRKRVPEAPTTLHSPESMDDPMWQARLERVMERTGIESLLPLKGKRVEGFSDETTSGRDAASTLSAFTSVTLPVPPPASHLIKPGYPRTVPAAPDNSMLKGTPGGSPAEAAHGRNGVSTLALVASESTPLPVPGEATQRDEDAHTQEQVERLLEVYRKRHKDNKKAEGWAFYEPLGPVLDANGEKTGEEVYRCVVCQPTITSLKQVDLKAVHLPKGLMRYNWKFGTKKVRQHAEKSHTDLYETFKEVNKVRGPVAMELSLANGKQKPRREHSGSSSGSGSSLPSPSVSDLSGSEPSEALGELCMDMELGPEAATPLFAGLPPGKPQAEDVCLPCGSNWTEMVDTPRWGERATLEGIRSATAAFATQQEWTQFHRPRNLCSALASEVGNLTEAMGVWRDVGYGAVGLTEGQKRSVGEELGNCLVYLVRLADVLDMDLPQLVQAKMLRNQKYPPHLVQKGSAKAAPQAPPNPAKRARESPTAEASIFGRSSANVYPPFPKGKRSRVAEARPAYPPLPAEVAAATLAR